MSGVNCSPKSTTTTQNEGLENKWTPNSPRWSTPKQNYWHACKHTPLRNSTQERLREISGTIIGWMEDGMACSPNLSIEQRSQAPNDVGRMKHGLQAFRRKGRKSSSTSKIEWGEWKACTIQQKLLANFQPRKGEVDYWLTRSRKSRTFQIEGRSTLYGFDDSHCANEANLD